MAHAEGVGCTVSSWGLGQNRGHCQLCQVEWLYLLVVSIDHWLALVGLSHTQVTSHCLGWCFFAPGENGRVNSLCLAFEINIPMKGAICVLG